MKPLFVPWLVMVVGLGIAALAGAEPPGGEKFVLAAVAPGDPLGALHAMELKVILPFQRLGNWGRWMQAITDLGPGRVTWLIVAFLFVAVDARLAIRAALVLLVALWLRELLALTIQSPRPYWIEPLVRTFRDPPISRPGYSLPSGHALGATAFWLFLASTVRRPWAWFAGLAISVAVCVSRVYLGVHFISDVVAGFVIGLLVVWAAWHAEPKLTKGWTELDLPRRFATGLAIGFVMVAVPATVRWLSATDPGPEAWARYAAWARRLDVFGWLGGGVCGLVLGLATPGPWARADGPWSWRLRRLAILALPALLYLFRPRGWTVSNLLPEESESIRVLCRFVLAAAAAWGGLRLLPWFLIRLGVARPSVGPRS